MDQLSNTMIESFRMPSAQVHVFVIALVQEAGYRRSPRQAP